MLRASYTFAATPDLPAAEQGVVDEVRQPTVEVDRGQAALEALPGHHQLREVLVHVGAQASDEQVTLMDEEEEEEDGFVLVSYDTDKSADLE